MKKISLNKLVLKTGVCKDVEQSKLVHICNLLSIPLQFLGCFVLYFIMESMCRHSVVEAWEYLRLSPLIYLYNTYLIFTTSMLVYLCRRRILARIVIGSIWFALGAINGFLLLNRVTPFTGPDLKLLADAASIMNKYLSPSSLVLVMIGVGILILFFVFLFWKGLK